jgi:hypothetical protein
MIIFRICLTLLLNCSFHAVLWENIDNSGLVSFVRKLKKIQLIEKVLIININVKIAAKKQRHYRFPPHPYKPTVAHQDPPADGARTALIGEDHRNLQVDHSLHLFHF